MAKPHATWLLPQRSTVLQHAFALEWETTPCSVGLSSNSTSSVPRGLVEAETYGSHLDGAPRLDFLRVAGGGGAVVKKTKSPVVGVAWVIVRSLADPRRSYLSYLSMAKERMKVICLETWESVIPRSCFILPEANLKKESLISSCLPSSCLTF